MKPKPPKSRLPTPKKVSPLERGPTPAVLPPAKSQHTNVNVNVHVEGHLMLREFRKLLVALVFLISFVLAAVWGS